MVVTSRSAIAFGVLALCASIDMPRARSQPAIGAGSAAAASSGGSSAEQPPLATDDEDAGASTGSAMVAPADPKARLVWLQARLAQAVTSHGALAKAKIGAYVVDLSTNTDLYSRELDAPLEIASNAKLLTTFSALSMLGGGFRWRTAVYVDDIDDATGKVKGNVYLRGRGDPTLSGADLEQLAADVAARGIKSIDGQLVVDATYFDAETEPPHFADQPKERAGYRAPVAALGVAKSAVTVTVLPVPGGAGKVELDPPAPDYVRVAKSDVKTLADQRTRLKIDVASKGDHLEVTVAGQINPQSGSYDVRKRVDDPVKFAAAAFRAALAQRGVKLAGKKLALAAVPATAKLVAAHDSATLAGVVREMNKNSDNYIAESVLKTLGAQTRQTPGPATWADGKAAVAAALAKLGMPPGSYRADNGSGLYNATGVTARQLVTILRAGYRDFRVGPDLVASLPVGGVDGTLAKRWSKSAARGRVRAKTGTLDKVISIAGYVGIDGAHQLAFAVITDDIPAGQRPAARAMADEMVDAMLAYLDAAAIH